MKIICVTGKSGSGKTTFASLLSKKLNCEHIDIDKIGHQALLQSEIINALCDKFGTEILYENGSINRKKLGNIVFSDKEKMKEFSSISWNYIERTLDTILLNNKFIILDGNLLPNTKYWNMCNYKILINSDNAERKNKILERDNISEEYFNKRESASLDYSQFKFDYIFENNYQLNTINNIINKLTMTIIKEDMN